MVSDGESDNEVESNNDDSNENYIRTKPLTTDYSLSNHITKYANNSNTVANNDQWLTHVIEDEEDRQTNNHSAEFLQWHHRLGHVSPKKIRLMAQHGILPSYLYHCPIPVCSSCMFGKMTRRPWRTKGYQNKDETSHLKLRPGECVSIDQLESTTPGLVAQLKGIPTTKRYNTATVFVDHATRFTYVHLQTSRNANETIKVKLSFETLAASVGIKIYHYHADNGRFAENKFREAITKANQTISFCGVNAHFQNGIAERKIRELQDHSRTMLIHATKRWSSAITANLWPYALRVANLILNETPNLITGKIPYNDFTKSPIHNNMKHWHTFGCPVYILDNDLQSGKKIDKWSDRSKMGINLGKSPHHAKSVYLVLSLTTGLVSPQYHIKMDDKFETLRSVYGGNPPISQWQEKCHFITNKNNPVIVPIETSIGTRKRKIVDTTIKQSTNRDMTVMEPKIDHSHIQHHNINVMKPSEASEGGIGMSDPTIDTIDTPIGTNKLVDGANKQSPIGENIQMNTTIVDNYNYSNTVPYEVMASFIDYENVDDTIAYAASKDPDTMYLHEAMRQPDKPQFLKAMQKEVDGQIANGNFALVHIEDVPKEASILPAVWAMRRKRRIDTGEVYKWKARLNIDGSKQIKGVNYWDTYAPVASWPIIRFLLILVLTKQWKTRQIDYVQAYTQADAETDLLYMKIPKGFTIDNANPKDYVLSIKKNIYGQKQAGRVWNRHLVQKLLMAGFTQSNEDECVFYHGKCIYMLYTDDSILAGPTDEELDAVVQQMKDVGLDLTVENAVDEFLGVKITPKPNGEFELTQPQLIKSILNDLRLSNDNVSKKDTPATTTTVLRRHTNSENFDRHFDYRSIIGKMNYLEKSTRPDISCAVHQCARFTADPKMQHGKAVKHIGRYLAGSAQQGLIYKPDITKSLECFVDSDFSGNWNKEDADSDMDTARSRTGYVIRYAGCPIVWGSKLQTHIALSSTEAEYIAISTAMREVIPLMALLKEMSEKQFIPHNNQADIHCQIFEDNSGAIEIAQTTKYRPRTKHINTQYHHFRYYVDTGQLRLQYIPSKDQLADMLTKSLPISDLQRLRKRLMGW